MARKSRKAVNQVILPAAPSEKIYRAGLYARISVETERKREADTIGNQIQLLKDFSSENLDIDVVDIYVDDDISGTDFVRPEFSRMMNDSCRKHPRGHYFRGKVSSRCCFVGFSNQNSQYEYFR